MGSLGEAVLGSTWKTQSKAGQASIENSDPFFMFTPWGSTVIRWFISSRKGLGSLFKTNKNPRNNSQGWNNMWPEVIISIDLLEVVQYCFKLKYLSCVLKKSKTYMTPSCFSILMIGGHVLGWWVFLLRVWMLRNNTDNTEVVGKLLYLEKCEGKSRNKQVWQTRSDL